jgi:dihydroorotase-like cyclic amidohydrolase
MQNTIGELILDFTNFPIIDLNLSLKDGKISNENTQALQNSLVKEKIFGYMMPQLQLKTDSESQLTLLTSLYLSDEVRFFPTVSGIDKDGSLSEIASLSKDVYAIYFESNIDFEKMKSIFQYAKMLQKPVICKVYSGEEPVYETEDSYHFGHVGRSQLREPFEVAKVIEMSREFNVKTLFQSVTVPRALRLIDNAKNSGMPIFLEMSINHILNENSLYFKFDNFLKIDPPFQSYRNLEVIQYFLKSGKIDMLTSLHREISESEKSGSFKESAFGVESLKDLRKKYMSLVEKGLLSEEQLHQLTSKNQLEFLEVTNFEV